MSNAPKRATQQRTLTRRRDIASAVLEIVDESGHDSVTTALVAEHAGMSEATVMYHFPTKDHLLVAAAEHADELAGATAHVDDAELVFDLEQLREIAARTRTDDPRRRLYHMVRGQALLPDHPAADFIRRRDARVTEVYARLVRSRQQAGLAQADLDVDDAACQMLALYGGLEAMWIVEPTFDLAATLVSGIRRLLGENVMEMRARLDASLAEI